MNDLSCLVSNCVANVCSGHRVYYLLSHINVILELFMKRCLQDLLQLSGISELLIFPVEGSGNCG